MKKTAWIVPAVVILLVGFHLIRRNRTASSITSHCPQILTVDAQGDLIGQAVIWTHEAMGDRVEQPDGTIWNKTLRQSEKSWKDEKGRIEAVRGWTKFQSKGGTNYVIETVHIAGRPTMVLLSSDNEQETMKLHDEFTRALSKAILKDKKSQ